MGLGYTVRNAVLWIRAITIVLRAHGQGDEAVLIGVALADGRASDTLASATYRRPSGTGIHFPS